MAATRTSFEHFVATNADGLLRTAHLITADQTEAEDLVQECLMKIATRWSRIGEMEQPLAYTRRILVRMAIRDAKARQRRKTELDAKTADDQTHPDTAELFGARDELFAALRKLTPRQRAILVLRYFHDLSEEQVAQTLGCSTGTIKNTTSRSLTHLRELVRPATTPGARRYE